MDKLEEEEREIKAVLKLLYEDYLRVAEPYIKRLTYIYSLRPPPPIIVELNPPDNKE